MVDLARLKCRNRDCPAPRSLEPAGEAGRLRCTACGDASRIGDVIKPYAQTSAQWLIGAGAAFGYGWSQVEGPARWALLATSGTVLAYAVYRIVWQARTLRALR